MAFALTQFVSYGTDIVGPSRKRGIQGATLTITSLVTDVDLDISDAGGTFWTEAQANATFGQLATKALDVLQKIAANAQAILPPVRSPQLMDRLQAAAPSGTSYTLTLSNSLPDLTFDAGNGETSWLIDLQWLPNDFIFPIISTFG